MQQGRFKSFGPVRYARLVMDPATKRSRGTGFVNFYKEEDALACIEEAERLAFQTGAIQTGDSVSRSHGVSCKHWEAGLNWCVYACFAESSESESQLYTSISSYGRSIIGFSSKVDAAWPSFGRYFGCLEEAG